MSKTQETSVTSSQDRFAPLEGSKNEAKLNGETKADSDGAKVTVEDLFPWITEFKKKCRCSLAQPNIVALIRLMKFYARNVSVNVSECYTKPYRAAKLKDSISETLLFFFFYYRELVEVCDRNSYLDKMSDLLAMYVDMELKASRRGKEHHSKIAARLTSCLYVYLEDSHEHILDTFIKARFVNRNYHEILDPILTKISNIIPEQPNCDASYVRYLLIYRLWKKVNNDAAVKNQINTTAISHLGPPPTSPTPFLAKYVLPKIPKSQANSTKFLLLHKFDIEKSCRLFVQYCKENREDGDQAELDKPPNFDLLEPLGGRGTIPVENLSDNVNIPDAEKRQPTTLVKAKGVSESCPERCVVEERIKSEKNLTKNESGEISTLKPLKAVRVLPRLKNKKTGDILFIDLTADETTEKIIKKKKVRKLHWLTEVKKKLNKKVAKLSEKKKKSQQTVAVNNPPQDLPLLDLADSTSARTLSTATTPEPPTTSTDPVLVKSLSTATTPEPENCVTSNFVENDFDLVVDTVNSSINESPDSVGKQSTCGVTTTVTESNVAASNAPTCAENLAANSLLDETSQLPENSCHTTYEQGEISPKKSDAWTVGELSKAFSHICESYNSESVDNSIDNLTKLAGKAPESTTVECEESVQVASKEVSSTEADNSLENSTEHRSLSESSEVAVIFTRRASDVDIVDLDDYSEENGETQNSDALAKLETTTEKTNEHIEGKRQKKANGDNDLPKFNSDLQHLTLRTGQLKLSKTSETLQAIKHLVKEESIEGGVNERGKMVHQERNGSIKKESLGNADVLQSVEYEEITEGKIDLRTGDNTSIEIVNRELGDKSSTEMQLWKELNTGDCQIGENTLGKLEKSKAVNYCDYENHCDYRSSKSDRLDDVELQPSRGFKIAKREGADFAKGEAGGREVPKVRIGLIDKRMSIPKINEILIRAKNVENNVCNTSSDFLGNEEPQFSENIDGLSLLASVSQHVSHLEECSEKTLSKPKIINREIRPTETGLKIYSRNVNTPDVNNVAEEVVVTSDSYENFLDLNAKPSDEIIDAIADVPRQIINDEKMNLTETKSKGYEKFDQDPLNAVPLILETTADLSSSKLQNNLISVENVTQIIKDSANVIVNGETVVLYQKSPNSNLYIINKAVDNEGNKSGKKNSERNSTAMRDIINHIPINTSEKNAEGVKIHRNSKGFFPSKNKTTVKKMDILGKKYENQLLSKQFQPICTEKFRPYVDKLSDDYVKKEILSGGDSCEDVWRQRCTDTPESVIELEPVKKSPPPVIRFTDTPVDLKTHRLEESVAINTSTTGRLIGKSSGKKREEKSKGMSNENLTYKQNIKQEFTSCVDSSTDKISCCYGSQISRNDSEQLARQNLPSSILPSHFSPVNSLDSSKIPHVYSTVTTGTNLYNCDYSSCGMKVSSSQSYQSVPQPLPSCQLSHCASLKCAYELHCGQYVQRSTSVAHSSYLQTNSYYLPANASSKNCNVQEQELKLNEVALAKLHDDELLHNIEQSIIDGKQAMNDVDAVKTVPEVKYKPEFENKLPLKKRLKAHAMLSMSYQDTPMKVDKVQNYPGTPMMSIAALEAGNDPQSTGDVYDEKSATSTPAEMYSLVKDDSCNYTTEMIRRDYVKDTSLTSIGNCANVDDRARIYELQHRKQSSGQVNIPVDECQKTFKTMAQRKEMAIPATCSLKRAASGAPSNPKSPKRVKKAKTTSTKGRQTRSSKRNIPKVDYSYDAVVDLDPKWNASNELKRKRKKTSR